MHIQGISERILKTLEAAGWTPEKLAHAQVEELTVIEGIGPVIAQRIIIGARRVTAETRTGAIAPVDPVLAERLRQRAQVRLKAEGWHAGTLATATPKQLAAYDIARPVAEQLIQQARQEINQAGLAASLAAQPPDFVAAPPPPTLEDLERELKRLSPDEPIPPMSVRLKRIWITNELAKLRGQ